MLFSSTEFLFGFLPVALLGYLITTRFSDRRVTIVWLVLASLFFYGWWNPRLLPLLIGSITVNYAIGRTMMVRRDQRLLILGIVFNLGLLGYFKYTNFLFGTANELAGTFFTAQQIVLPLAISFFTFQQIAYLVDVYQDKASEPNFLNYTLFVCFFPQLIAGPIVHHSEMIPQFRRDAAFSFDRARTMVGGAIFFIGLYKKAILADGIAPYADRAFNMAASATPGFLDAWAGALAYSFQIYFDFSGYSDMAIGVALVMGIRLPQNFNSPYKATSIIEFWRCWHMTLSRFLRDYLYVPLGGNRRGPVHRYANLMIVMLLGGLWHGAGWTFVLWGGLHGLYLVVNHGWARLRQALGIGSGDTTMAGRIAGRLVTFLAVTVAWVFFRAESWDIAVAMLAGMVDIGSVTAAPELSAILHNAGYAWLAALLVIVWALPNAQHLFADFEPVLEEKGRRLERLTGDAWGWALSYRAAWLAPFLLFAGGVASLVVVSRGSGAAQFIYMVF